MLLSKYDAKWADDFNQIKQVLIEANQQIKIDIEHIGSTAIPSMSSKPIIDIDLIFFENEDFSSIKENLGSIGYYHNGDQGIPGREVFKRQGSSGSYKVLDEIAHHLYICHESSEELRKHLVFRDLLRSDKHMALEYEKLKLDLAKKANQGRKIYAQLKESEAKAFFEKVLTI